VSPREREFLLSNASRVDEYEHNAAAWRIESAGMFMWAFDLIHEWPKIDEELSPDLVKQIPTQKVGFFSKHPKLRLTREISEKRDLIEFWHWRVRTRQLIEEGGSLQSDANMRQAGIHTYEDIVRLAAKRGYEQGGLPEIMDEDFVFKGKPFRDLSREEYQLAKSIIMERHYALNWLCGLAPGNRWDETPTHT